MTPSPDTLLSLYHSGAFLCTGIVAVYLLLRWGSTRIAWLEVPNRAHYVTAFLAGLALVLPPAVQGQTPSASMIAAAIGTMIALLLPGATPAPKSTQAGFVSRWLMGFVAVCAVIVGCSWFRGTVEPDVNAVIDCGKQEATAQTIEDIVATFAAAVASGNVAAAVEGLVTKYGTQIVACSLAAIEKQPASGSAVAATTDPTAQAAAAVIASHGWKLK